MSSVMQPMKKAQRPLREQTACPTMPLGISRLNCEAICGLTERQLYDLGRTHNLPRLPGKVPVYRADAVLALFSSGDAQAAESANDAPLSAAAVLALIGRRAVGSQ